MDINNLIKSLKKGNNLEQNLSLYGNMLAGSYNRMAAYHLAMNLVQYYDEIAGCGDEKTGALLSGTAEVLETVFKEAGSSDDAAAAGMDMETAVNKIDKIRGTLIKEIGDLQAYTYFFQIYEHMLNRIEYRLSGKITETDVEAFADEVKNFVNTGDVISSNERIQAVISELPVRMTMMKFTDMVRAACRCYTGVRNDMAERFFEAMAESVRPLTTKGLNMDFKKLYESVKSFESVNLQEVGSEGCEKLMAVLADVTEALGASLLPRLYLSEIVNHLYIYMLTKNYVQGQLPDTKKAETVINEFIRSEEKGSFLTPDEDIVGILTGLTKRQEKLTGEHMLLENAFYEIITLYPSQIDGLCLNGMYNSLYYCNCMFNEGALNPIGKRSTYFAVDASWIDAESEKLCSHYKAMLSGTDRTVKRAQMAFILGSLPVVTDSIDDFEAYVSASLLACDDKIARAASMSLIGEIIRGDSSF